MGARGLTAVCVFHHRVNALGIAAKSCVSNARDVEAVLRSYKINLVLSGHVHEATIIAEARDGHQIIYTGAGSAAVNQSQRSDGVQNQYCIHVIDRAASRWETLWRAYNPSRPTPFGSGGWVMDSSISDNNSTFTIPPIETTPTDSTDLLQDGRLKDRIGVYRNPFIFSNAEKIPNQSLLELFVSDEARHKGAKRLSGDAIIRGSRGAGKTMLLRFLELYGTAQFEHAVAKSETAECLPIFINFSVLHPSELGETGDKIYQAADALIYRSVLEALDKTAERLGRPSFKDAVYRLKQRLDSLKNIRSTLVSKLGSAVGEYLSPFCKHLLLLIDEIAPVFPREFFESKEHGFLYWMNSIRNSGPFYTRVAVYPNDVSDVLNEERFGALVNLDFNIKNPDEYRAFVDYCRTLTNNYLKSVSCDQNRVVQITDLVAEPSSPREDGLEQLIYASDGSPRRFLSLMDKCFNAVADSPGPGRAVALTKIALLEVIKDYSSNLVNSYSVTEREIAASIAKACKKQVTFRFRAPGLASLLTPLHSAREESNIVKLAEVGAGRRGSIYEFTFPYCVLMEIQTHYMKDTRKVCASRDRQEGEWISVVTTVKREEIESLMGAQRITGSVIDIDGPSGIIKANDGRELWCDDLPEEIAPGHNVSFIEADGVAMDVVAL